jgi:hypothetical protein
MDRKGRKTVCHGQRGTRSGEESYVFGARNAARVVDSHFPLVQGCDGECGLTLCHWNARPFIIEDGTTREFKEPR